MTPIAIKKAVTKKSATKTTAKKAVKKAVKTAAKKKVAEVRILELDSTPEAVAQPDEDHAWHEVVKAIQEKQGRKIRILDLRGVTSFTDYFIITNGSNYRQNMAICDEVEGRLKRELGERPTQIEGYSTGEWVLMDYGDYIVHVFSEEKRAYYDLERLYRNAKITEIPDISE